MTSKHSSCSPHGLSVALMMRWNSTSTDSPDTPATSFVALVESALHDTATSVINRLRHTCHVIKRAARSYAPTRTTCEASRESRSRIGETSAGTEHMEPSLPAAVCVEALIRGRSLSRPTPGYET